jgi:hypothetical protein
MFSAWTSEQEGSGSVGGKRTTDYRWVPMIPASWNWQKKSKILAILLAEFLLLPCPIRDANAPMPLIFFCDLCG